jgi:hypothetical protein
MRKLLTRLVIFGVLAFVLGLVSTLAAENRGIEHGARYDRLVIRNVIVIDGKGTRTRSMSSTAPACTCCRD